jgi:hypothetical protein
MVRDSEIETDQAGDGADQPFGLPQSQAEHGAQRQRLVRRRGLRADAVAISQIAAVERLSIARSPPFR